MPAPAVILPMQVKASLGNCNFQAASNGMACLLATVKSNSKSSPSVSAASKGGFVGLSALDASLAARLGGNSADPAMAGKLETYARQYLTPESRKVVDRAISTIKTRIETRARLKPALTAWFAGK